MIRPEWNDAIRDLPGTHVLQTREWGHLKAQFGWEPITRAWMQNEGEISAGALTLVRRIPMGGLSAKLGIAYVPKGPLLDWHDEALRAQVLKDIVHEARRQGAIFIKIDPEVRVGTGVPGAEDEVPDPLGHGIAAELKAGGWVFAPDQIQYRNTVMVDLAAEEDGLLAAMKQKTRYNVRLAGRRGVAVREGTPEDFPMLFRMYAETAARDGFVIRDERYYLTAWDTFHEAGMLDPLIAEVAGEPVAAVVIFRFGGTAVYMHGMSRDAHREKMPNYLLQWEAMRRAKAAGCTRYDMWGAPDTFSEEDSMWGVYRFKEGFNGTVVRHIGAWDYPIRPFFYTLYTKVLPRILGVMRRRGLARSAGALD